MSFIRLLHRRRSQEHDIDQLSNALNKLLSTLRPNTVRAYQFTLQDFEDFTRKRITECTRDDASDYIADLRKRYQANGEKLSPNTIRRYYHGLSSICGYLHALGLLPSNIFEAAGRLLALRHCKKVRETPHFQAEEVTAIINKPDGRTRKGVMHRAALALLFGRGPRRSEAIGLKIGDFSFDGKDRWIYFRDTKGGGDRAHIVPAWVWDYLADWLLIREKEGAKPDDFVFPITDRTLARIYKKYTGAAPHSARKTFAMLLKGLGYDARDTAAELGHGDLQTVYRNYYGYVADPEFGRKVKY